MKAASVSPSIDTIIRVVSDEFRIPRLDIVSARRDGPTVVARHAAMWLSRSLTPHSLPAIGRSFGNRDHSSVMYAISRAEARMDGDGDFGRTMLNLKQCLEDGMAAP